jgi:hypothetical protein
VAGCRPGDPNRLHERLVEPVETDTTAPRGIFALIDKLKRRRPR